MAYRMLSLLFVSLALVLFAGVSAPAGETKKEGEGKTARRGHRHEGTVVSVTANKLVMKGKAKDGEEAREHSHTLAPKAKVTCDGKECKLEDLKRGQRIRVTTRDGDRTIATRVEALNKDEHFGKRGGTEVEKKDTDRNRR